MNCIEEWNRKCKNCFSRDHEERNCPQICYECGAVGHISSVMTNLLSNALKAERRGAKDARNAGMSSNTAEFSLGTRLSSLNFKNPSRNLMSRR